MSYKPTYEELERKISELMEAEGALRNKEETVRALLTATTDSVFLTDVDGIIIASNKLAAQRFGKNMNEFTGKCVWDFLPLELAKTTKAHIDDLIRSRKPVYYEEDRKAHFFYNSIYPVLDARGKVERIAFFARDITERKQAEDALMKSETKYRELVQNANSIILRMDIQGNVTFFNEFAQRFFGYTEDEILSKNVVGTIVPETETTGHDLEEMIKDIGTRPERYISNENENIKRNRERVWIAWTNKAIRNKEGEIVEILCIGNDITKRKQMQDELAKHRDHLEELVKERTKELQIVINSMSGREVRMAELKKVIKKLRSQLEGAGMQPVADDPLKEVGKDYT